MQHVFIKDRALLDQATELMHCFGPDAEGEAAARANSSRDLGNLLGYCRWKQVGRLVAALLCKQVFGTVH